MIKRDVKQNRELFHQKEKHETSLKKEFNETDERLAEITDFYMDFSTMYKA